MDRMEHARNGSRRRAKVVLAVLVAAITMSLASGSLLHPAQADILDLLFPTTTKPAPPTTKQKTPVPVKTWLASPAGDIPSYDRPNGTQIGVAGYWYGHPQTMPIIEFTNDGKWAKIRLPERPNGKTAWVKRNMVKHSSTPYRIVIDRSSTSLTLYKDGWSQWTAPVGLGKASTPTPLGNFYLGVTEPPESPGWGPYVLGSTGHSEAIQSWQGSGDAVIAIHGPLTASSDRAIGSSGTYISNGCVRMHQADNAKLGVVPLGTPIDIVE